MSFSGVSAAQVRSAERALLAEERHMGRSSAHEHTWCSGCGGAGVVPTPRHSGGLLVGVEVAAELSLSVRCAGCRRRFCFSCFDAHGTAHKSGQARATSRAKMDAQGHERKLQSCVLCAPQVPVSKPKSKRDYHAESKNEAALPAPPAAPKKAETAPTMAQTVHDLAMTRGCAVDASAGAGANSARFPAKLRGVVQGSQNSTSAHADTKLSTGADTGAQADAGHTHAEIRNDVLQESYANHLQGLDAQAAKRLRNAVDDALSSHVEKWQDLEQGSGAS